jgi:hypothetical protein
MEENTVAFPGFPHPDIEGFTRVPNEFIENEMAKIDNMAELKVILYAMRHTWGYQEYGEWKFISIDEFANGRKRKDGTRMDSGTGLGTTAVKSGLRCASKHGYLIQGYDRKDLARIRKAYYLKMKEQPS